MELTERKLTRIAGVIRTQLILLRQHHHHEVQRHIYVVAQALDHLQGIRHGLGTCLYRGWHAAAGKLVPKVNVVLRDLPFAITELERATKAGQLQMPSLRHIYEDLRQCQQEFGRMKYDPAENTLSAFTEPIELEGLFLGDFEIQLHITAMAEIRAGNTLRVVALDPHPAACNDTVTHPHVSEEFLCAGDATVPIQAALIQGRICDFFMLVRSVLEMYNPSSPYISISDWEGTSCYECGYTIPPDDSYYCETCGNTQCEDCISGCSSCSTYLCQQCMSNCYACEEPYCPSCLIECAQCGEAFCPSCMNENLCTDCHEEMEKQDEESETNEKDNTATKHDQQVA